MKSARARAERALTERLRDALAPEVVDRFVLGTHTQRFADNLLRSLSQDQIDVCRAQLGAGGGGELNPSRKGKRPAHAPYSSAALVVNEFGRWLGSEASLSVAGLGGFTEPVQVEAKLRIGHGGGTANLDCLLRGPDVVVGVEAKLTETLRSHSPRWEDVYRASEMATLLSGGWRSVFQASLEGRWTQTRLGLDQLVRHALALNSRHPEGEAHLVYVFWEPANADEVPEIVEHRQEVSALMHEVGSSRPKLHALTHAELWAEWARLDDPAWVRSHVDDLKRRYNVAVAAT